MLTPAKLTDRFLAYLVDVLPFAAGYFASLAVWVRWGRVPAEARLAGVWFGLYLFYQTAGNLSGATLGKRLLGLRVVDLDGRRLGLKASLTRAFGYLVSAPLFSLGFAWSLFEPRSRAWHDLMAGSWVVELRPKSRAAALLSAAAALFLLALILGADLWILLKR